MRAILMILAVSFAACGGEPDLPTCAELSCRWAASGTPDHWTPCFTDKCWCDGGVGGGEQMQCSRTPCAAGDVPCAEGSHAEFNTYVVRDSDDAIHEERVCFCMTDGS